MTQQTPADRERIIRDAEQTRDMIQVRQLAGPLLQALDPIVTLSFPESRQRILRGVMQLMAPADRLLFAREFASAVARIEEDEAALAEYYKEETS